MNNSEFDRYLDELQDNWEVKFPKREATIDFFSILLSRRYRYFVNHNPVFASIDASEKESRNHSDTQIIKMVVKNYLNDKVYDSTQKEGILSWLFGGKRNRNRNLSIDTSDNDQLYKLIVDKLGRADDIEDVFGDEGFVFTIEGEDTIKLSY